jgi:hypothetical protein
VQAVLGSPALSVQAQPVGGAEGDKDHGKRSAIEMVAGRAMIKAKPLMGIEVNKRNSVAVFLVTLSLLPASGARAAERIQQLPSATEVFHLRSLCAKLGEQLSDENVIGSALTQDQVSHYDPKSNRCYVELSVRKINPKDANDDYINRTFYDGQTKEMLAFAKVEKGKRVGMIFDKQRGIADPSKNLGWDDASAYIDDKMSEDRN